MIQGPSLPSCYICDKPAALFGDVNLCQGCMEIIHRERRKARHNNPNCPYYNHADGCDCQGMGGDR